MITTINKDILTVEKGVIVHSVNCIGGVGGLAGAIARKWPITMLALMRGRLNILH
jgi:O-acetyl-ADP-ribose deacetylase (regulator of RNase III)